MKKTKKRAPRRHRKQKQKPLSALTKARKRGRLAVVRLGVRCGCGRRCRFSPPRRRPLRRRCRLCQFCPKCRSGNAMRLLTLNRKGDDVARWQQFLADHGFDPGPIDGFFGGATRLATIAFQKQHHLTPDGVVGGATRAAAAPAGFVAAVVQTIQGVAHGEDDVIDHIGGVPIFQTRDGRAIYFKTGNDDRCRWRLSRLQDSESGSRLRRQRQESLRA